MMLLALKIIAAGIAGGMLVWLVATVFASVILSGRVDRMSEKMQQGKQD